MINHLTTDMIVTVVTITTMMKAMLGLSNPLWILIDFGSRVHHQDKFLDALFYNPYDMFMPRVKEALVSIVAASKIAVSVE